MKQPKKLTYEHKQFLAKHNYDPNIWMLQLDSPENYIYINKLDGQLMIRNKETSRLVPLGCETTKESVAEDPGDPAEEANATDIYSTVVASTFVVCGIIAMLCIIFMMLAK